MMRDPTTNPMTAAQRLARRDLPRRFFAEAAVGERTGGFAVLLDGRPVKTPAGNPLVVPGRIVAEALAAEWAALREQIDPAVMPLTRIVNVAIDRVAAEMTAVRAEIIAYVRRDLICYRAEGPQSLVEVQEAAWDTLIAWASEVLGAPLVPVIGIVPVDQDLRIATAVEQRLVPFAPLALAALHTATTLTGSAVIALALAGARLSPDDAWRAAYVDEDWQMERWGKDEIALAQRAARRREFDAAALILAAATADSARKANTCPPRDGGVEGWSAQAWV